MKQSNGPQQLHNLPSSAQIDWSRYDRKHYLHFDEPVDIGHVKNKIQDPTWVSSHAFFPFIHFKIRFNKYVTLSKVESPSLYERKRKTTKIREIYYASHKDRFIYKYYGDLLNNAYNNYVDANEIDDVAVAYRNNKYGKNNIYFAYEVFEFLFKQKKSIIISIDFKEYFDRIAYKALKQNIKRVLRTDKLSDDWYKVFKNLIKYSYVNRTDTELHLKQKYGIKKRKRLFKNGKLTKIMSEKELRLFKEDGKLYNHKKPYGIPKGSGMSAVCSNVQLIDFDKAIKSFVDNYNGLYRRYSDDMVLVIPVAECTEVTFSVLSEKLNNIISSYKDLGIIIQKDKTDLHIYENGKILNKKQERSGLDYLGFVTDGETISLREKSLFKYYTRAYRKAETSKRIEYATDRKGPREELYNIYTHLGFRYKDRGNFITYATKAHKKMSKLKAKSNIDNQIKRHWTKINRRLKRD